MFFIKKRKFCYQINLNFMLCLHFWKSYLHSGLCAFMLTPASITMRGKFRRATRLSRGVWYCAPGPKSPPFYKMSPRVFSSLNNTKMAFLKVYEIQQTFVCCYPFLYVMIELMRKFNILKKSEFHENYKGVGLTDTLSGLA